MTARVDRESTRAMITRLRQAEKDANEAISAVGKAKAAEFARLVSNDAYTLGAIEARNLGQHWVTAYGGTRRVGIQATFGSPTKAFSGGATTTMLVRPYEFGSGRGEITVTRRTRKGSIRYTRRFPKNTRPEGRLVLPLAKRYASEMVSAIAAEVYRTYRLALGDPGWVKVTPRG